MMARDTVFAERDAVGLWQRCRDALLSVVYPSYCLLCGQFVERDRDRSVCPACWARIRRLPANLCLCCGVPLTIPQETMCGLCLSNRPPFQTAHAYGLYQEELREIVHHFKFHKRQGLAAPLGDRMAQVYLTRPAEERCDWIVPVPLSRKRLAERGFNQTELLARRMAKRLHLPVVTRSLVKRKNTPAQSGLTDEQRRHNVQGAFSVHHPEHLKGKRVLLVDDVYTTGATLMACSQALSMAGAATVRVITLARVPHLR